MLIFDKKRKENNEQIKEIAIAMFRTSLDDMENIFLIFEELKLPKKEDSEVESKKWNLFYELIIFYMHCLDRMSFKKLPVEEKSIFMSKLFKEIWSFIEEDYTKSQAKEAKFIFTNTHNKRQSEYSQYQDFLPKKGEPLDGTLLWEISSKISKILYSEANIFITMPVLEYLNNSLENRLKETKL